jgi:xanthine dehydrogenase accessory factor
VTREEVERRVRRLRHDRVPYVSATVVRAERPTSAKPGDLALVLEDGTVEGFVGGQCAAETVRAQSLRALMTGEPTLLRITPAAAGEETREERPGMVAVANPCLSGGTLDIFLEPAFPPPLVAIYGEAPIARALREAGRPLGYDTRGVEVPDDGPVAIPRGTEAVVVATHGRREEDLLAAALAAGVPYVGLVASRQRGAAVVASLEHPEAGRVHTPAGLDIGAHTPGEVALSILAQVVSERARPRVEPAASSGPSEVAGTAVDPVCGMRVGTGPQALSAEAGGHRYWFCGSGCRTAFLSDPSRYVARPTN